MMKEILPFVVVAPFIETLAILAAALAALVLMLEALHLTWPGKTSVSSLDLRGYGGDPAGHKGEKVESIADTRPAA